MTDEIRTATCLACRGTGCQTDLETGVAHDDVCPTCGGDGVVWAMDLEDRAYGQHDTWAEWRGER